MNKKIYLIGPVTDTKDADIRFQAAAMCLNQKGMDAYNPVAVNRALPKQSLSRKDHMNMGIFLMSMCECVAVIPGYERHTGCEMELAYAKANNYPVQYLSEDDIRTGMKLILNSAAGTDPKPFSLLLTYTDKRLSADYRDGSGTESYAAKDRAELEKAVLEVLRTASSPEDNG